MRTVRSEQLDHLVHLGLAVEGGRPIDRGRLVPAQRRRRRAKQRCKADPTGLGGRADAVKVADPAIRTWEVSRGLGGSVEVTNGTARGLPYSFSKPFEMLYSRADMGIRVDSRGQRPSETGKI